MIQQNILIQTDDEVGHRENEKLHDLLGSDQDFEPSKNKNSDSELLSDTEVVDQKRNL